MITLVNLKLHYFFYTSSFQLCINKHIRVILTRKKLSFFFVFLVFFFTIIITLKMIRKNTKNKK